jgi:cobalt/nickel transport system permease protein
VTAEGAAVAKGRKRRKSSFAEKTLAGISANIESALFSEAHARRDGTLQHRDGRAKLLAFVAMVVAVNLSRHWEILVAFEVIAVAVALASDVELSTFLKRAWLGVPVFSGMVVLPSIFFIHGPALFSIPLGLFTLTASQTGVVAAAIFVLRVGVSVSFAVLLVLTTPWAEILRSLRAFRVPTLFIIILAMTYRYIFLFLHTVNGIFLARQSRTVARTSGPEQRRWIVQALGVLLHRSFRMSEEVYQAMLARGFDNRFRSAAMTRFGLLDGVLVAGAMFAAVASFTIERRLL